MTNSTVNTYMGGMDRDTARNKYSNTKYYHAKNIRILTNHGLSTGNVMNENGMNLSFKLPSSIAGMYELRVTPEDPNHPSGISTMIRINGFASGPINVDTSVGALYNQLISSYNSHIVNNEFRIFNCQDFIKIVGLGETLTVTVTNLTETGPSPRTSISKTVPTQTNPQIVGSANLRDWLIIFSTTGEYGQIWKMKISKKTGKALDTVENFLVPGAHLASHNAFNFSMSHRVLAKTNYESPEIGKVYFTDTINTFRHVNIFDSRLLGYPMCKLEIVPNSNFATIKPIDIGAGGRYQTGVVQYAYSMFNLHGNQSSYSTPTGFVHITADNDKLTDSQLYTGRAIDQLSGKFITVEINNLDRTFDFIRVVSIWYNAFEGTPTINIVKECAIPPMGTIRFNDTGDSLGSITSAEFVSLGLTDFTCKTFEIKDNMLFPANITQDFYDPIFDARAYRFTRNKGAGQYARVLNSSGVSDTVTTDFKITGQVIPENHDCGLSKELQRPSEILDPGFAYNLANELGGEGPNTSYRFKLTPMLIDNTGIVANTSNLTRLGVPRENTVDNPSYTSYASPFNVMNKMGWMRDEIYRVGLIFKDTKGRASFVKWIGDIKFPAIYENDTRTTYSFNGVNYTDFSTFYGNSAVNNNVYANILSLQVKVKNMPPDAVSYQVVRCKREEWDKTILAQGYWKSAYDATASAKNCWVPRITELENNKLGNFISPEISFFKNLKPVGGDSLRIQGTAQCHSDYPESNAQQYNHKAYTLTPSPNWEKIAVIDAKIVPPSSETKIIVGPNIPYINYCWEWNGALTNNDVHPRAYFCTNLVTNLDKAWITFTSEITELRQSRIVNYERAIIPYGGQTSEARTFSMYQTCMQPSTVLHNYINVFGGDTFIDYFENLRLFPDGSALNASVVNIPVETTINLALRHDKSPHRLVASGLGWDCMRETAGSWIQGSGPTYFTQSTDLYLYNTVYSKQADLTKYFPKPLLFSDNRVFDCRIMASLVKSANEEIDSWTHFLAGTKIDVNGAHGPINNLQIFEDALIFAQDRALGVVSVNEKVLTIPDELGVAMTIGKGGLLDDFKYITTKSGCMHRFAMVLAGVTKDSLYYYDALNNKIGMYTISGKTYAKNETVPLSFMKSIQSDLNALDVDCIQQDDTLNGNGVHLIVDAKNGRVLFTFLATGIVTDQPGPPVAIDAQSFTIAFNELMQSFETFFDFTPGIYHKIDQCILSALDKSTEVSAHGFGKPGWFYNKFFPSSLTYIVNSGSKTVLVYATNEYNFTVENTAYEDVQRNFDTIKVENEYQNSGRVTLVEPVNTRRRFRIWHNDIPRNINGTDKMRSAALLITMEFINSENADTFRLEDITTHFVGSKI